MRHELRTEIDIDAPPERIWGHLIDLRAYADWNPFITAAEGVAEVGTRLSLRMDPPGGRGITIRPTVTALSEGMTLEWVGHLGIPGIFDGRHRFELAAAAQAPISSRRSRSAVCSCGPSEDRWTGGPARASRP